MREEREGTNFGSNSPAFISWEGCLAHSGVPGVVGTAETRLLCVEGPEQRRKVQRAHHTRARCGHGARRDHDICRALCGAWCGREHCACRSIAAAACAGAAGVGSACARRGRGGSSSVGGRKGAAQRRVRVEEPREVLRARGALGTQTGARCAQWRQPEASHVAWCSLVLAPDRHPRVEKGSPSLTPFVFFSFGE